MTQGVWRLGADTVTGPDKYVAATMMVIMMTT